MTDTSGGASAGDGGNDRDRPRPDGQGVPPLPPPAYPGMPPPYGGPSPYPPAPPSYPGQPPAYGGPTAPGYPGTPAYPGGYGLGDPQRKPGWSGLAIAAFICAVVLPCLGLVVAIPLAIVALVQIKRTHERGKGLAIAAIVIAVLWVAIAVGLIVWAVASGVDRDDSGQIVEEGRIGFSDIRTGDCVDIPDPASEDDIDTFQLKGVPCAEAHNAEAVTVIGMGTGDYPGFQQLGRQSLHECDTAVRRAVGDSPGYQSYRLVPTEQIWDADADGHRVICFVTRIGFADMTGSIGGS